MFSIGSVVTVDGSLGSIHKAAKHILNWCIEDWEGGGT